MMMIIAMGMCIFYFSEFFLEMKNYMWAARLIIWSELLFAKTVIFKARRRPKKAFSAVENFRKIPLLASGLSYLLL